MTTMTTTSATVADATAAVVHTRTMVRAVIDGQPIAPETIARLERALDRIERAIQTR